MYGVKEDVVVIKELVEVEEKVIAFDKEAFGD